MIDDATLAEWYKDRARPNGYAVDQWVVRSRQPVNATTDVVAVVTWEEFADRIVQQNAEIRRLRELSEKAELGGKIMQERWDQTKAELEESEKIRKLQAAALEAVVRDMTVCLEVLKDLGA